MTNKTAFEKTDLARTLSSILRNRKNANLDTFTCFVDKQKAFDRVNRDILYMKLAEIGVTGNFLHTLKQLYSDCQAAVDVNGTYTDFFDNSSGVKQGDVISPTRFAISNNDLCQGMKELNLGVKIHNQLIVSILLFADDIALIPDSEEHLQRMLDFLSYWCSHNKMSVNISKTKVVNFRKKINL